VVADDVGDDVAGDDDLDASEMNFLVESWDTVSLSVFFSSASFSDAWMAKSSSSSLYAHTPTPLSRLQVM